MKACLCQPNILFLRISLQFITTKDLLFPSKGNTQNTEPQRITRDQWIQEQNNDASISETRKLTEARKLLQQKGSPGDLAELHTILCNKQQFLMWNGLLYRKIKTQFRDQPSLQFILPTNLRISHHYNLSCLHISESK